MQEVNPTLRGIGVMSGSSIDGIDMVLADVSLSSYDIIRSSSIAIPDDLKIRLSKSADLKLREFLILESEFSKFVAKSINQNFPEDYDFISIHGHTTHHVPTLGISNQMVSGATVSALTRKKVITDFRVGDIALDGVGTPLVPILEKAYFKDYDYFLNLGGIANLTIADNWNAYDVCPCNQLGNFVCRDTEDGFDRASHLALGGVVNMDLYTQLDDFEYYTLAAPKSIDNNWLQDNYFPLLDKTQLAIEDKLCTINRWIADKILENLAIAKMIFITGGGVYNKQLIDFMRNNNKDIKVHLPDAEIIEFKEALLMVYLGYLRMCNIPNILSSVTGAQINSLGGAIYNIHVNKRQRILITGATGFIGSYICRYLVKEGYETIYALKRNHSSTELLGGDAHKIQWLECDLLDQLEIDKIIAMGFDLIIHSAAIISFSPKDDDVMIDSNTRGTRYLVDSALMHDVKQFIHISSVSALGKAKSGNMINENTEWVESKNNSPYSISKKASEMEVWRAYSEGLDVTILNPSIVLGAGYWNKSSVKIFGNMIRGQKLYPAGSNGFVDVRDVASAVLKVIGNTHASGQRILLNGANMSFKSLMDNIAGIYKVPLPRFRIRDWMIPISWRLMSLYSFLSRKVTVYNKYSVISSSKHWKYDNSKSIEILGMDYREMDITTKDTAEAFIKSQSDSKNYGLLSLD